MNCGGAFLFMANLELQKTIQSYEDYISKYGITEEVINAYADASYIALAQENDIEYGLKVSARAKEIIEKLVNTQTNGDIWDLDSYCNKNKVSYGILDKYYEILKSEAPYLFHSYLLYLEKNREESERFYSPKIKQLNKHGLIQAMQDLEDDKIDILSISMPPGTQKCQPLYSKVLTPDGFIEMREVDVGTKVVSATGNVVDVLSVSAIKKRPIYELTLDDGSKVRCSDNHLWTVQTRDDRKRKNKDGSEKYRTIELSEMLKNYKVENGKRCNYSIDYVSKIEFPQKDFLIHPYVMGVILGDGGLTQGGVIITTKDGEIIDKLNELLPCGYQMKHKDRYDYRINGHEGNNAKQGSLITKELKRYGLYNKTSLYKFIPKDYMYSSYDQRLWLLRGLMDTDGSASRSYCSYATISKRLADDVCELVHSLGGYVSVNKRKAGYKKYGNYIQCNDYYELLIQFSSNNDSIFNLTRKKGIYKPKRKRIKRFITDIKYIGEEDCKCIYINDESHLYITDNYIITHNTTLEKFFCSWIIGRHPKDYSLFFSHSDDITRMFYDGVLDITTNNEEYTWAEIFPNVKLHSTDAKRQRINFDKQKSYANIQCTSVGSKNAGKVRCNRYLYCDDLIGGIEEALNKRTLDKLWRIYGTDARQRKLNEQVKEIHIATRWSVHDVIGRLKLIYEGNKRARFIAVPDIDPITGQSNFDYKYNGMSVEFFHDQELTMDEISYKCLYKNEPIEREGLLYHEDDIRRFLSMPMREPDAILGICDVKNKGTDFMFLPCMYQYDDDFYLADCICDDNTDYGIQYERLSNIIVQHNMQQCEFESNSGGDRVSYEVNKLVEEKGGRCNITDKPTETNKETRIIVNSDWVKKHVLFKDRENYKPKDDYGIMMSWLMTYSVVGKNEHDDVPDGLANFCLFITKPQRTAKAEAVKNPFRTGGYGYNGYYY